MKNKGLLYDIIYVLAILGILCFYHFSNVPVYDDLPLVIAVFFIALSLFILFGSLLGKVAVTAFLFFLFNKLTGTLFSVYAIITLVLFVFAAVLYFLRKEDRFKTKFVYRFLGLFCLYLAFGAVQTYHRSIESQDDGYGLSFRDTDLYAYHHFDDEEAFIERFGSLSRFHRELELQFNEKINKDDYEELITSYINRDEKITSNAYTGQLKDKSLFIIETPALYDCYVSEELTPNIYRLRNDGLYFKGFNNSLTKYGTPSFELMTNLSLFPTNEEGCSTYLYDDDHYEETLAGIFKRNGYETRQFTNDYETFYNRDKLSSVFEYDDILPPYDFGLDGLQGHEVMFENIIYYLTYKEKTMVYYTPFDCASTDEFKDTIISKYPYANDENIKAISELMNLDRSIGYLLNTLEEMGQSENVVTVIYGIDEDTTMSYIPFAESAGAGRNNTMYIYSGGIGHRVIDKISSSLDILPTLSNLWGYSYDNTHIIGRDIMDNSYPGVQFSNDTGLYTSWYVGDNAYYYPRGLKTLTGDNTEEASYLRDRYLFSSYWFKYGKQYLKEHGY